MRVAMLVLLCACGRLGFMSLEASDALPGDSMGDGPDGSATATTYRKRITIDRAKVSGGIDLLGFPMLVDVTDADLRSIANGGKVARSDGFDITFTSADGTSPLPHEIERYTPATGELIAWVKLPVLSPSMNITVDLKFGDPFITASQENRADLWGDNYTGVWHMSESAWNGTAGECIDSTGINHGTAQAAANTTTGRFGRAALFGPNNDTVDTGTSATLRPGSITVSAWVVPQSVGSTPDRHPYIVYQDYWRAAGTSSQGYYMEIYRTVTNPRPTFYTANGPDFAHAFATTSVVNGAWYYVVGTRDATTGVTSIYVNGVREGSATMAGGIQYIATNPVLIGGRALETWQGVIDEVRISSLARSADWIATEYNNQLSPQTFYTLGPTESL